MAVSVESLNPLEKEAQRRLEQNLSLARDLGAEVVVTHDGDVAQALVRVALQNTATQIVVVLPIRSSGRVVGEDRDRRIERP